MLFEKDCVLLLKLVLRSNLVEPCNISLFRGFGDSNRFYRLFAYQLAMRLRPARVIPLTVAPLSIASVELQFISCPYLLFGVASSVI